jgi:tetratricopeptide (TPR) repeat protein
MNRRLSTSLLIAVLAPLLPHLAAQAGDARVEELYAQAKAAQAAGDLRGAISKYEEMLRIAPKLAAAYNNLGALYFRARDYHKAASVLEQGLKISPGMPSASALLGISLFEMGDYAKAKPRLEAALKANPRDGNARMFLAKDLTKLGDYEAAAAQLQQLAASEPKNQEVWYLLAKVYMKLSEVALAKMNAIDSGSVLARELSGEMMEAMNNYDGAVVELQKAVEMAPRRPGTHEKLGDAYWTLSKWDSAAEQFQAELAIDPGNCMARWKLGNIVLQKNGSAAEALADVDQALAACPDLAGARVDRAKALIQLNRAAEAVPDLQAAIKSDPSDPAPHFLLAKTYRALGRAQDAQAEMQAFRKLEESARAATAERAREVIRNKETAH